MEGGNGALCRKESLVHFAEDSEKFVVWKLEKKRQIVPEYSVTSYVYSPAFDVDVCPRSFQNMSKYIKVCDKRPELNFLRKGGLKTLFGERLHQNRIEPLTFQSHLVKVLPV